MMFLTSKIMYNRTTKNDVPEFSKVLLSTCTTIPHNVYNHDVGNRFVSQARILWFRSCNMETAFVACYFMRRGMRVAHILARKLHGWLGFRTEQGEPFPRRRLLCVVRSFDIPVYTRETRYAEWILTRRNCTHNCDAIRSIITFDSIINVGHLFESRTR